MPPSAILDTTTLLTIRLKHSTQTTLLLAEPRQPLGSLASDLLDALHGVYPDRRLPNGTSIPESAEDVLLGTPNDINDLEKGGYTLLWGGGPVGDLESEDNSDPEETPKKKKSNNSKKATGEGQGMTVAGAGLKNGSVLAFKFRRGGDDMDLDEWVVKVPRYDDEE